jgi:hypothetical protein
LAEVPVGAFVRRLPNNPIVTPDMLPGDDGSNINGPSLIRAPDWLPRRLGNYYLYFAHHSGKHIRLAVADRLEGPWRLHPGGTLQLSDARGCRDHVASPDVHVDDERREIRMFFHGFLARGDGQKTFQARSADGLDFTAGTDPVADFYLRVVAWRDEFIGMAHGGVMYRLTPGPAYSVFRRLPTRVFPRARDGARFPHVRHVALKVRNDTLHVYYSRIGDQPESIRRALVELTGDPASWVDTDDRLMLAPETTWEGAELPLVVSRSGASSAPENAVRDPAIFEEDGKTYLLYAVAGESGIAIAEIVDPAET